MIRECVRTSWTSPPWLRFPAAIINCVCIFLTLCALVGFLSSRPAKTQAKASPGPGMIELLIAMFFFAVSSGLSFASHFVDHKATEMIEFVAVTQEGQRLFADLEKGKMASECDADIGAAANTPAAAAAAAGTPHVGSEKNKNKKKKKSTQGHRNGTQPEPELSADTNANNDASNRHRQCSVS